ncbi:hypothetical protein RUND412_004093 [Rhizina undulata]
MEPPIIPSPPVPPSPPLKSQRAISSSSDAAIIKAFWQKLRLKKVGQPCFVLPDNRIVEAAANRMDHGKAHSVDVNASFEEARRICVEKVKRIAKECRASNMKYRDVHFDLSIDCDINRDCIDGLINKWDKVKPLGVSRVEDIFEDPKFYINGATAGDVEQGKIGDCWFLAALAIITNVEGLIERVCVARDEETGVYGFVFYRDGEWTSTIVDDQLFLKHREFGTEDYHFEHVRLEIEIFRNIEAEYRKAMVQGSRALYFSACHDQNETWLPLLEKAYAKAHGDYGVLYGGYAGEAVEDLTGGVTSELSTRDILDKKKMWNEEVLKVNKKFLFAAVNDITAERFGIQKHHSYSVLRAVEAKGQKLVLLKNPWGTGEWTGAWSDGSKEWTAEWMTLLDHKFGDDGIFWMSFDDFLRKFTTIDRTRLFDDSWKVASKWATLGVEWAADYSDTRFEITVTKPGPLVVVLQQLDTRYFRGLEGIYDFELSFRIQKDGETEYIRRSRKNIDMRRSVNAEVTLEPGTYWVFVKITATKNPNGKIVSDAVRNYALYNREKFLKAAVSHDLAFAKGLPPISDFEPAVELGDNASALSLLVTGESFDSGLRVSVDMPRADYFKSAFEGTDAGNTTPKGNSNVEVPAYPLNIVQEQTENVDEQLSQKKENQCQKDTGDLARKLFNEIEDPGNKRDHSDTDRPPYFNPRQCLDLDQQHRFRPYDSPSPQPHPPVMSGPRYQQYSRWEEEEEDGVWDPVVVLGLRVYSQDPGLTVDVIRPDHEDELDLDDISRNAVYNGHLHAPAGGMLAQPVPRNRARTSVPSWADF